MIWVMIVIWFLYCIDVQYGVFKMFYIFILLKYRVLQGIEKSCHPTKKAFQILQGFFSQGDSSGSPTEGR